MNNPDLMKLFLESNRLYWEEISRLDRSQEMRKAICQAFAPKPWVMSALDTSHFLTGNWGRPLGEAYALPKSSNPLPVIDPLSFKDPKTELLRQISNKLDLLVAATSEPPADDGQSTVCDKRIGF